MRKALGKMIILSILLVLLDQLTKFYAFQNFRTPFQVIGNFSRFIYVENIGIAFGLKLPLWLILLSNFVLLIVVFYFIKRELDLHSKITQFALAFLITGAGGNLIDRFSHGYVIDFISIWHYPAFNFADIYITLAVLLLTIFYAKIKRIKT